MSFWKGSNQTEPNNGMMGKIFDPIANRATDMFESTQNFQLGIIIFFTGLFLIATSFLFLPFVILRPYKFCLLNSLGTITIFASILVLRGSRVLNKLFSKEKIIFTLMFLVTFILELYFSLINPSYWLVLISAGLHFLSTLYIILSFVPYGTQILNKIVGYTGQFGKWVAGKGFNKGKEILPF